ncbi:MAG TPA: glucuronate isomerase [Gemmataceae bacterium]|nr:glucuronate isomerase [Gemmataceae bacterium]
MIYHPLAQQLYTEICRIPIIDSHTHIDALRPTSTSLADILGYHYYTELAHSAGLSQAAVVADADPREKVRAILYHMSRFDNTAQHLWFLEIARAYLGFDSPRLTVADTSKLCDLAERLMAQPGWEERVLRQANIEKVFLTNAFDDPLEGFDTTRYIPCLRTDDLVFHLHQPEVRKRLVQVTATEPTDARALRAALARLFEHFTGHGARACAISLPPSFTPAPLREQELSTALGSVARPGAEPPAGLAAGIFWLLAELCDEHRLPFDLMIGVNRRVYEHGVYQGQDLFDQRTSLLQYARLFNAFPKVVFPVSVLSSGQNQELVAFSWIFPNVITHGHWWYSNVPAYIEPDLLARLQAVPKTKQLGYYSDMYKLEFGLPKFNMYRRILAHVLAEHYVRPGIYSEAQALELCRMLLRDNARRIFNV